MPLPPDDKNATRQRIFKFLLAYKRANDGLSPTYREIGEACGISSTSVVAYHLRMLERRGLVTLKWHESRAITINGGKWEYTGAD